MSFLIRHEGDDWRQPATSTYGNEAELQDLLATSPSLIPVDEELRLVREFWIPEVGSVDLVGITASGAVVVVECKLKANPQIRREVVGQALAYAGGLWQMPVDEFIAEFEFKAGESLDDTLRSLGSEDPSEVRSTIAEALRAGDFRVVIAVDQITSELRTIVEYLNGHTAAMEVVALELDYTKDGNVEILVPTIYGLETATAKRAATTSNKKWNLTSIRESLDAHATPEVREIAELFLAHGAANGTHFHFGSGQRPGMSCYYLVNGEPTSLWALYPWDSGQALSVSIGAVAKHSAVLANSYVAALRRSPEIAPSLSAIESDLNKYPTVPISTMTTEGAHTWLTAIDDLRDALA